MKLARTLPGLLDVLALELVLAFCVIAGVIALLLPGSRAAVGKAQLSKILSAVDAERTELAVHMALTGDLALEHAPPPKAQLPTVGPGVVSSRIVAGGIRYEGTLDQPFYLTVTPAVSMQEPTGTVMWLCGNAKAPPGWTQPVQPGTNLPPKLIPYVCRD